MTRHALGVATIALVLPGCGRDETTTARSPASTRAETVRTTPRRAGTPLVAAACPAGAANCRSASGRIILVQAVDPDGDGDAHFVLASRDSVTFPGISVIDVEKGLRPVPLPKIGDRISAAGPVYQGSYGQHQIQATVVHVGR